MVLRRGLICYFIPWGGRTVESQCKERHAKSHQLVLKEEKADEEEMGGGVPAVKEKVKSYHLAAECR